MRKTILLQIYPGLRINLRHLLDNKANHVYPTAKPFRSECDAALMRRTQTKHRVFNPDIFPFYDVNKTRKHSFEACETHVLDVFHRTSMKLKVCFVFKTSNHSSKPEGL